MLCMWRVWCGWLCSVWCSLALGAEPLFEAIGVGQIPRGVVPTLAQDRAGTLWVATGDGLVRFDGHRYRPQLLTEGPEPERNLGWIRALLPTPDGRVWIGTETRGVAVYNPDDGSLRLLDHASAQVTQPVVRALAQDTQGGLWVGQLGGPLRHYAPSTGRWRDLPLPDGRVEALLVDQQGLLWIASWQGLLRLDPRAPEPVATPAWPQVLGRQRVTALHQGADGQLWIGTQAGELWLADPGTGQLRQLSPGASTGREQPVASITSVPGGAAWVARLSSLEQRHAGDGRLLQRIPATPGVDGGLQARQLTHLLVDRTGWLWVSGLGMGLQRHNPANQAVSVLRPSRMPGARAVGDDVRQTLALRQGDVWLATPEGVLRLDAALRPLGTVRLPPGQGGAAPSVTAMAQGPDGLVWLGASGLLFQVSPQGQLLRRWVHGGGLTRSLRVGRDGTLWAGTEDGLHRLPPRAHGLSRVQVSAGLPLQGEVHGLAEDDQGRLWFGAMKGLYRCDTAGSDAQPVPVASDAALGNPVVLSLLFDRQGRLWVDTAVAGLHLSVDARAPVLRFQGISVPHGELGRPFGANLQMDAAGRLWTHMYMYDPDADRLHALGLADGVSFGTGWFHSASQHADGRLFFGGSQGLLVVGPQHFVSSQDQPPVVVTELRVDGRLRPVSDLARHGLALQAHERGFSVAYAALDLTEPARLRHAHQLQGYDSDWVAGGADFRLAAYGQLPPGQYLLKLRGSNRSGLWSERELHIPVQVLPAWWQQLWVRALGALGTAAAVLALLQWRTRHLRRRQAVLERRVQERTAALEEASFTDPLTGLRNRRYLSQHIGQDVSLVLRQFTPQAQARGPLVDADLLFFLIDIDHFKAINDQHGHAAGDAVLQQLGERLRPLFRDSDHIVRWGGEEFLVVARGSDRRHAAEIAERVRQAVAEPAFTLPDGRTLPVRCSIGFSAFPLVPSAPQALDWAETLSLADAALYDAKARGRHAWTGALLAEQPPPDGPARLPAADWLASGAVQLCRSGQAGPADHA